VAGALPRVIVCTLRALFAAAWRVVWVCLRVWKRSALASAPRALCSMLHVHCVGCAPTLGVAASHAGRFAWRAAVRVVAPSHAICSGGLVIEQQGWLCGACSPAQTLVAQASGLRMYHNHMARLDKWSVCCPWWCFSAGVNPRDAAERLVFCVGAVHAGPAAGACAGACAAGGKRHGPQVLWTEAAAVAQLLGFGCCW
jgi:hypothetical protein